MSAHVRQAPDGFVSAWYAYMVGPGFRRLSTARSYHRAMRAFVRDAGITDLGDEINIDTGETVPNPSALAGSGQNLKVAPPRNSSCCM